MLKKVIISIMLTPVIVAVAVSLLVLFIGGPVATVWLVLSGDPSQGVVLVPMWGFAWFVGAVMWVDGALSPGGSID